MKIEFGCILLAAGLAHVTGCALMANGPDQLIIVESDPQGAEVRIEPGNKTMKTPGAVMVPRRSSVIVAIEKEGYDTASVTLEPQHSMSIWRNLVWIFPMAVILGISVDASTGCCYELQPDKVNVTLVPTNPSGAD